MKKWLILFLAFTFSLAAQPTLVILGTAQDAGYPHAGCLKSCCEQAWNHPELRRWATSLAVFNSNSSERWLFDASPDLKEQLHLLDQISPRENEDIFSGIFLTHAHIGHYLGLYHLGREVIGTNKVTIFAMEKMCHFLANNGPWNQLVELENISLCQIHSGKPITLSKELQVEAILVPHRAEYTETVGYKISGPHKTALFIPDIDSWEQWDVDINELINNVDLAFLDATFFNEDELPDRDLSEIPHPLVEKSMERFSTLSLENRQKIYFIHLNHSNPLLWNPEKMREVEQKGYHIALEGMLFKL